MLNCIGFTITPVRLFRISEAQVWVGIKKPRPEYLDPHPGFLTDCAISYQDYLKKANIQGTITRFYNSSVEDFRTSEAQVWVGVKILMPRYLDRQPVFLTDCVISYQDNLKKANV